MLRLAIVFVAIAAPTFAQSPPPAAPVTTPPADYVIGLDDVLGVLVWDQKDLSLDVVVRPDGHVTLPLINDVPAVGLTPKQLREDLQKRFERVVKDSDVTVVVRQVNSRKVYITGRVSRPGAYPLLSPLRVIDVIALAGGLLDFADTRHIKVLRSNERGEQVALNVDYRAISRGESLAQNVLLRPGDSIVVP